VTPGILFSERPLLGALLAATLLAVPAGLPRAFRRRRLFCGLSLGMAAAAGVLNIAVLGAAWTEAGRPPFKTLYETLLLAPACIWGVTLVLVGLYRLWVLVPFSAGVNAACLLHAVLKPDVEISSLPPALQSAWFVPHVVTYFAAYAGLFASFVLALLALIRPSRAPGQTGPPGFEDYAHRAASFGIAALTLGLGMGAAWGKEAWGDYWTWDPKENWALVSWLSYLIYLHLRRVRGWKGRPAMTILLLSFLAVVFTYLGMRLLPTSEGSLHVYQ